MMPAVRGSVPHVAPAITSLQSEKRNATLPDRGRNVRVGVAFWRGIPAIHEASFTNQTPLFSFSAFVAICFDTTKNSTKINHVRQRGRGLWSSGKIAG